MMSMLLRYIFFSQNKSWEEHRNPGGEKKKVGGGKGKLFFDILLTSELICSSERSQMSYQQLNFDFC